MAANLIENPFAVITDTDGTALENGYVYIGTVSLDPELNPAIVYWDKALTIIAAQPVRTINGYFSQSGSPGKLYINADDYSITVRNKNSVLVFTSLVNTDAAATIPMSSVTGQLDSSRVDFTQTGTGAVLRTVEDKFQDHVSIKDFGALGNGSNDDTAEIQAAFDSISSGLVYIPSGTYMITAPLLIRTTEMTIKGDGVGSTIIKCDAGFSGADAVHMQDPSLCTLEDLTIDGDDKVEDGLHVDDGIEIIINKVQIENCLGIGFKIRNVDTCILSLCGTINTGEAAFDFTASAALDAAATTNGIRCKLIDCYSSNANKDLGVFGSIYSNQVDTSNINVVVERYKEITNSGSISVASGTVHADHIVELIDCLFLDSITSIVAVFNSTGTIRTDGIAINESSMTAIAQLSSPFGGATEYGGLISIMVSTVEISTGSGDVSIYWLIVNSTNTAVNSAQNEPVHHVAFNLNTGNNQLECQADLVGYAGTYYFHITQLGGIGLNQL